MKFYNREKELVMLAKNREQSINQSVMTTLIGRRRTGKTSLLLKNTPILSKPGARNIKWQIDDPFLRFWFRFVYPYQGLIESNRTELLLQYVSDNYSQFTGKTLERFFHDRMWQT